MAVVETILSIVESASGDGLTSELLSMSYAEWLAWARARGAQRFFATIGEQTATWVSRIRYLRAAGYGEAYITAIGEGIGSKFVGFHSAMGKLAAEEAYLTHSALMAEAAAAEGTLVVGTATVTVVAVMPIVALVAVGMALGAPYYQARKEAEKEGFMSGFSKGFITGLLEWELRFTIDRFWDNALSKNSFYEDLPKIRAASHNNGLIQGRVAGLAKTPSERKQYLKGLRWLTKTSTSGWLSRSDDWMEKARARNVQISYVIDLAGTAVKHRLLRME